MSENGIVLINKKYHRVDIHRGKTRLDLNHSLDVPVNQKVRNWVVHINYFIIKLADTETVWEE